MSGTYRDEGLHKVRQEGLSTLPLVPLLPPAPENSSLALRAKGNFPQIDVWCNLKQKSGFSLRREQENHLNLFSRKGSSGSVDEAKYNSLHTEGWTVCG